MSARPRRRWRYLRRGFGYGGLLVLIVAALAVAVVNQLLPLVERHPGEVAAWLSQRAGQPVAFTGLKASWTRRGPLLELADLRLGEGDRLLAVGEAELLVAVYSGLLPGRPLTELRLRDLSLGLVQVGDGWRIEGLPQAARTDVDPLDALQGLGELQVSRARLAVTSSALTHTFPRADLRLRVAQGHLRAGVRLWSVPDGEPLDAVLDWHRRDNRGQLWLGGDQLRLDQWNDVLAAAQLEVAADKARIGLWLEMNGGRLDAATLDVRLSGAQARRAGTALPPLQLDAADVQAQWRSSRPGHWQLSVPRSRLQTAGGEQQLSALWMAVADTQFAGGAQRIDVAPLLAAASLSGQLPAGAAAWLAEAAPQGAVTGLTFQGSGANDWHAEAALSGVGFSTVGRRPGVMGLGGKLRADARGGLLQLDEEERRLDWVEFGEALPLTMQGELLWWREGDSLTIGSSALAVTLPGVQVQSRLEMLFQGDGSRPRLALAAQLPPFNAADAKRFWPRVAMPPPVQRWLNAALLSGRVENGRVSLVGDLDDWPFRNGRGRFDARANLVDTRLHFHDGWPDALGFNAEVEFFGPGMRMQGGGQLQGVPVQLEAGAIPDFKEPWLELAVRGSADAEALQRLVTASPLYAANRSHLDAITSAGAAEASVTMRLPLRAALGERDINGTLDLKGAHLTDARWDVDLREVRGRVRFSGKGFAAEDLAVRVHDRDGRLSLLVGDAAPEATLAAEFRLNAELPVQTLLARIPQVDWLREVALGSAPWQVVVQIPKSDNGRQPPAQLLVRSELQGVQLELPAPLRKTAGTAWPLEVRAPLPLSEGELEVRLGQLMQLRSRVRPNQPFAALLNFGGSDSQTPLPAQGIVARGQAPSLDIAGWIGLAAGGSAGGSGLRSVDMNVGAVDMLDRSFGEARLQLSRDSGLTLVRFDGAAINGTVRVAAQGGAPVVGRFSRLYWPPVNRRAMAGQDAAETPDDGGNPGAVPPLQFQIDDLRLGDGRLGESEFISFPTPEGMHIERFHSHDEALEITASGDWTRIGGRTRSRFEADFKADSLGEMLDALGFSGMVEDGPVTAKLGGDWPGAPGSFRLDRFDGHLRLDVGKGRLLDVEPGTGRLLGLISIAEVPRRLTLDFSDFFAKGFAFNTLTGDFTFAAGTASTQNLHINGPAAEIKVSGNTALATQQYDQRIEVLPKAGGVLPALGFATAGPAGAAIGAVAQAVLQVPLKQATRTVYSVQGPWAEPEVEVLERGPARTTTADPASEPSVPVESP